MSALTPDMRLRIAEALADAGAAADRWPLHDLKFADIAKQLAASYRAARRAVPENWSRCRPRSAARAAQAAVIHRYQMQIVQPLWKRFTKMWIAEAQKLRERLGEHQDLEVLRSLTEPGHPLAYWRATLEPAIARAKASPRRRCEEDRDAPVRRQARRVPPAPERDVGDGLSRRYREPERISAATAAINSGHACPRC